MGMEYAPSHGPHSSSPKTDSFDCIIKEMNKIFKTIATLFVGLFLFIGTAVAQPGLGTPRSMGSGPDPMAPDFFMPGMPPQADMGPLNMVANQACYVPDMRAFVVIDSIDCAVDLLVRQDDGFHRVGRFTTDVFIGRHDLKNILRPKSVTVFGDKIIVLASSQKDSSFLAVVGMEPVKCTDEHGFDTLKAVACQGFNNSSYAFQINCADNEIIVVGKNPVGYDLNFVSMADGLEHISPATTFHYHVPKQAERIKASDPFGAGLAVVAISVVFFALICVMFIMYGYGGLIQRIQNRNSKKDEKTQHPKPGAVATGSDNEVYAAIAAAVFAYSQDLHDVEDTVITIQKVERAWTPWNAKFYNMNKYFSERPNMPHKNR